MTQTDEAAPGTEPGAARRRWFPRDLAEATGLDPRTIHRYNSVAKRRRRSHTVRDGDMPKPDGFDAKHSGHGPPAPYWYDETIAPWLALHPPPVDGQPRRGKPRGTRADD